jgi:hypothetical protein
MLTTTPHNLSVRDLKLRNRKAINLIKNYNPATWKNGYFLGVSNRAKMFSDIEENLRINRKVLKVDFGEVIEID